MLKLNKDIYLTFLLIVIIIGLLFLNIAKSKPLDIEEPKNIIFDKSRNAIYLNSLTLKQKIAQMIITYGKEEDKDILQKMFIGGIFLGAKPTKEDFIETINYFQNGTIVPFFVATDMEGCGNPFENFQDFPTLREIETKEEAYQVGYEEGKLLNELGFNINFAPVVDLTDTIWNCRNFVGTPKEISEKAINYVNGLQENGVIATSKHYPGKALSIKDPHRFITYATIDRNDILPFETAIENNVSAIMISWVIVNGSVESQGKPSGVSEKLVSGLRNKFTGLIITDEINMLGLKSYYHNNIDAMYVSLFKADNDLILNFNSDPKELYHMISVIENAVKNGEISEERIDLSVIRILNAKGINVIK